MSWIHRAAYGFVADRGFLVSRHPAARRQRLFARLGVDLVLDVGAAVGGYGEQLRHFGYRGRIVSFEPMTAPYDQLQRRVADDPLWTARHTGVGADTGIARINVASNSDSSSLLPMREEHRAAAPQVGYVGSEEVRLGRLDDLARDELDASTRPFLKVDVQGYEREVLAGATRVVPRLVGMQLELSFAPLYDGGMLVDEAVSWAYAHGFRLVGFEQGYAAPGGEILQADGVFVRM